VKVATLGATLEAEGVAVLVLELSSLTSSAYALLESMATLATAAAATLNLILNAECCLKHGYDGDADAREK